MRSSNRRAEKLILSIVTLTTDFDEYQSVQSEEWFEKTHVEEQRKFMTAIHRMISSHKGLFRIFVKRYRLFA